MSEDPPTAAPASPTREGQRIAKVMARAGLCSRRDAEAWIAAGRVSVNGEVLTSPAFNVSAADDVRVDGERLQRARAHAAVPLPQAARPRRPRRGIPRGGRPIFDALPEELPRVVAVGRLDINTEGLLLLTNDGGLARVLELPATGWLRRYRVRAHGAIDAGAARRAERRRDHRWRPLRRHRGAARARAGLQRLADDGPARGQEPRDQARARASGPVRQPADPRLVRPVRARRSRRGRGRGSAHASAARPARREARRAGGRQFRRRDRRPRAADAAARAQARRAPPGGRARAPRSPRPRGARRGRRSEPEPSQPPRKRKHVSALRAEDRGGRRRARAGASSAAPPATARGARSRSSGSWRRRRNCAGARPRRRAAIARAASGAAAPGGARRGGEPRSARRQAVRQAGVRRAEAALTPRERRQAQQAPALAARAGPPRGKPGGKRPPRRP